MSDAAISERCCGNRAVDFCKQFILAAQLAVDTVHRRRRTTRSCEVNLMSGQVLVCHNRTCHDNARCPVEGGLEQLLNMNPDDVV